MYCRLTANIGDLRGAFLVDLCPQRLFNWCLLMFQGAQEMFRNLPHEYVDVAHLKKVAQHGSESMKLFT